MSTQELFEVAEWQVLEDEPLQSGVMTLLLGAAVSRHVHAAEYVSNVYVVQLHHRVARHTQKLRPEIKQITASFSQKEEVNSQFKLFNRRRS